jgi:hypothetical protein
VEPDAAGIHAPGKPIASCPARDWDRDFIDRVHVRDEREMRAGRLTPTHMFAVMHTGPQGEMLCVDGLTPAASPRKTTPP